MRSTVGIVMPWRIWKYILWADPELAGPWYYFVRLMIYLVINRQKSWDMTLSDTATMEAAYTEQYENIYKMCPKEKLLRLKLGDGWEPLCKFLEKDYPKNDYPKVNDREFFIAFRKNMVKRATRWAITKICYVVIPVAFLIGATWYFKRTF
jgi:hypothetical protein